jgi:diaminopimelate decarboxylase
MSNLDFPGPHFNRKNGVLYLGGANLLEVSQKFGTPLYVYDFDRIRNRAVSIAQELRKVSSGSKAFFAVKALGNLSVLEFIHRHGLGMDVVSGGEIHRCIAANIPPSDIIFSGVAKSRNEIELGIHIGLAYFNIESPHEVDLLEEISLLRGRDVSVALRINPDVDGQTHRKINTGPADTKFGLAPALAMALSKRIMASRHLKLEGISCHIGSQILEMQSFAAAAEEMKVFAQELMKNGTPLQHIDMGGGVGVAYRPGENHKVPTFSDWVATSKAALPTKEMDLYLEPGRSIVGDSGVLLTEVLDIKIGEEKKFVLVDAGMTELLRPAMYDAYHHIESVMEDQNGTLDRYDVVGPVCETSCWLGEDVELKSVKIGGPLAVMTSGAYGMSMASNYNTRPRPAEIAIEGAVPRLIRKKEALQSLWDDERTFLGS